MSQMAILAHYEKAHMTLLLGNQHPHANRPHCRLAFHLPVLSKLSVETPRLPHPASLFRRIGAKKMWTKEPAINETS